MSGIVAGLRALADALESGDLAMPTIVVVGRVMSTPDGSRRGSATDYLKQDDPPGPRTWSPVHFPQSTLPDDGA